ncbi:MAG: CoA transferase [Frankiaceae bacterium]|jgi:crotonobetainyl-CoA:carnitine CoA-transferase CaiB-like acyl-CoA transferase|nr:CoA transferase [Frankiaceae bacterium]
MDALQDIRVLDLTTGTAGPIVGMFLADFGAEVVKVETPAGDHARALAGFAMWNRGKQGVVVDPADPGRLAWLRAQIAGADVLLTNGGAQLTQFGLDPDRLVRDHGRLVLVELPPFLPGYTPWAGGHESAALLASHAGQNWRQNSVSGEPVDSVYPTVLYSHGVWGAVCTVAALVEREGSGAGQRVTVAGANAAQQLYTYLMVINPDSPDPSTAVGAGGRHPCYTRVLCGDGKWIASGALGPKFETALLHALGIADMLDEERMGGLVQNLVAPGNIDWAQKMVADAFLAKSSDEWLQILDSIGIPCGPMGDRQDWLDHPQIRAIGMREEVQDPERGTVVMPGIPIKLTATPGRVRGPAPALGQHSDTAPAWDPQPAAPAAPPLRPGPLAGYTILNSGTFVASPYAGFLLAELGANVIKVEPPTGDPFRKNGYAGNRGMRSLAIDLASPEGQAAFHRAAERADAFIDGLRPGVTTKLNIDYDTLHALNPGLVTMSLSAYGEGGEIGHKGGVDMVIQAMSGMMAAQGGDADPVANTLAVVDNTTAAMSALLISLGLLHKARTGQGQRTWDALAATGTYLQGGEITRFGGRAPSTLGGLDFKGPAPYDRMYAASDGWIRVQAGPGVDGRAAVLAAGLGVEAAALDADPVAAIGAAVEGRTVNSAIDALNGAGLAAVSVRKMAAEVMRDPRLLEAEYLHLTLSDDGETYICDPGRYASFSRTGRFGPLQPPGIGEHTRAVLREAGLEDAAIDELLAAGVVVSGGPMDRALAAAYR